jgi:hypothetical protein
MGAGGDLIAVWRVSFAPKLEKQSLSRSLQGLRLKKNHFSVRATIHPPLFPVGLAFNQTNPRYAPLSDTLDDRPAIGRLFPTTRCHGT